MSKWGEPVALHAGPDTGSLVSLRLRFRANSGPPVLLLHGGSAKSETFEIPHGVGDDGRSRALADWLWEQDDRFEPWLLDWRGSGRIAQQERHSGLENRPLQFDFDHAARWDVPAAVGAIEKRRPGKPISALGHCLGAAVLSQAIVDPKARLEGRLSRVVLLTLGLFYRGPLDTRLKSEDYTLDRLLLEGRTKVIDPRPGGESWPEAFETMYGNWPEGLRPHRGRNRDRDEECCDRLSYMYGMPWVEANLAPELHHPTTIVGFRDGRRRPSPEDRIIFSGGCRGTLHSLHVHVDRDNWGNQDAEGWLNLIETDGVPTPSEAIYLINGRYRSEIGTVTSVVPAGGPSVADQFGPIPLAMFVQGAKNLRRGFAAFSGFDGSKAKETALIDEKALAAFENLRVTLVTGNRNSLWHRDSVDRMYEWLRRAPPKGGLTKHVLARYGHQDLLWGETASRDVFPKIREGLA